MNARTILIAVAVIGAIGIGYYAGRPDVELPPPSEDAAERSLISTDGFWGDDEKEVPDLGSAQLVITVRSEEEDAPVAGVRVFAMGEGQPRSSTHVDRDQGRRGESPRTNEAGIAVLEVGAGYLLWVSVTGEGPYDNRAHVRVPILAADETRELVVSVRTRFDRVFHLCVLAEEDDRPLAGAELFLGEGGGSRIDSARSAIASTDENGGLTLPLSSPTPPSFDLVAEGREPARVSAGEGFASPARRMVVRLARSARLHGRITSHGDEFTPERVRVYPDSWYPVNNLSEDRGREVEVRDDGTFEIEGLPTQVPLGVTVEGSGQVRYPVTERLVLEPAESREVTWEFGRGATVRGRLADAEGKGGEGLELWLVPLSEVGTVSLGFLSFQTPAARTRSGDDGKFRFEDLAAGDWVVGLAPSSRSEFVCADDESIIATSALVTVAPEVEEVEVTVPLHHGEFIEGRVLPEEGEEEPPDGDDYVMITAWSIEGGAAPGMAQTDEEGRFRLGPLVPGRYLLRAGMRGIDVEDPAADPFVVEAATGASDVHLRRPPTGSLAGTVLDRETGRPARANVTIYSRRMPQWLAMDPMREEFSFGDLAAGEHYLQAQTPDGRVGTLLGVQVAAGETTEDLVIHLDPGQFVRLRYRGPTEYARYRFVKDGVTYAHDALRHGTRERTCLPLGTYELILTGYDRTAMTIPPTTVFEESRTIEVGPDVEPLIEFQIDG